MANQNDKNQPSPNKKPNQNPNERNKSVDTTREEITRKQGGQGSGAHQNTGHNQQKSK